MIRFKRLLSVFVAISMMVSVVSFATPVQAATTINSGDLIKGSMSTVYYYGADGNRYNFPNEKTYFTWYNDFSSVKVIDDSQLGTIPLVGNVTYRPGSRMIKLMTDPRTYAIERGGTLRWVTSEAVATSLYGAKWNTYIDDMSDAFFPYYTRGEQIDNSDDFAKTAQYDFSSTINIDKGLVAGPYAAPSSAPVLTDPGTSVPSGSTITFHWTAVSGATRYRLERDTTAAFTNPTKVHSGAVLVSTDYQVPSTTTTYYYRVSAINPAGSSSWSNTENITVSTTGVPTAPTLSDPGLFVSAGASFTLSWSASSGATTYQLEQATNSSFTGSSVIYSGSSTSYSQAITPTVDTTYYFRVQARNAIGHSAWSNTQDLLVTASGSPSPTITMISNVPDASHPANNVLGVPTVEQYSHPLAAANITAYWDDVQNHAYANGVNSTYDARTAANWIGWFMNTNDDGSTDRSSAVTFGTSLANAYLGLVDWVVWDGVVGTSFGFDDPGVGLLSKQSYVSWDFDPIESNTTSQATAWTRLKQEINAGRPVWVSFSYWNPESVGYSYNNVYFYDWGTAVTQSSSATNADPDANEQWQTSSNWTLSVGHGATAIGYIENYDAGTGSNNWVIVHDTWDTTPENLAIPFENWIASTHITLQANSTPEAPEMYDPGFTSADGIAYNVGWSKEQGATTYCWEVDDNSSFLSAIGACSFNGSTNYMPGSTAATSGYATYYYRVRACNTYGCSAFSNTVDMIVTNYTVHDVSADYGGNINAALAAASSGDVVLVSGGSYVTGTIMIPDGVYLIGAGPDTTTINANNAHYAVILGSGSVIRGFKIKGATTALVYASSTSLAMVQNCVLYAENIAGSVPDGVLIEDSYSIYLYNNTMVDTAGGSQNAGVRTNASANNYVVVMNNLIDNFAQGEVEVGGAISSNYNAVYTQMPGQEWIGLAPGASDIVGQATFGARYSDLTLEPGSIGINTGNPGAGFLDIDGTVNDMGAYGGPAANKM